MIDYTQSHNIVVLYYPPYAGGKFITNCLGFNERCCPSIQIDKDHNSEFRSVEYYLQNKIPSLFKTIPPDQDACKRWIEYEVSCGDFWGDNAERLTLDPATINDKIFAPSKTILDTNYGFLVTHHEEVYSRTCKTFLNAKTLKLVNYQRFITRALEIKTDPSQYSVYMQYAVRIKPVNADFAFNMDTIFAWDDFYKELIRCCRWLEIEPLFDSRLKEFYQLYIDLHA